MKSLSILRRLLRTALACVARPERRTALARLWLERLEDRLAPSGTQLVITTEPPSTTVTAGHTIPFVVKVEDAGNNVDTSFNGKITVANTYYGYKLGGALTVQATAGVATFPNLAPETAGNQYVYVSSAGFSNVTSTSFTVQAAAATKLDAQAPYGAVVVNGTFSLSVQAEDPYGNIDSNYAGNVTLALANNPSSGHLTGTLTQPVSFGYASYSGLKLDQLGTGYTLRATSSTGLTASVTPGFNVVDQLVVTTQPNNPEQAGSPFTVVVKAEDGNNVVATGFHGTVTVVGGYGDTLAGPLTAVATNGVATFSNLVADTAGGQYLNFSSPGLASGSSQYFTVNAATAKHLNVSVPTGTILTNGPFSVTVNAVDDYGNTNTGYTGSITLALLNAGSATLVASTLTMSASSGTATFSGLTINQAGRGDVIQATSGGLSAGLAAPFNVINQLVVTTQPTTVTAGTSFSVTVKVEDFAKALISTYNGPVTLTDTYGDYLTPTATVQAVGGVATFSGLVLTSARSHTLTASSPGTQPGTSAALTVTPAAASQLVVDTPTGPTLLGAGFSVRVQALDAFGNVDTNYSNAVTLALFNNPTGATLGGTRTLPATAGVVTFTGLTLDQLGQAYSLQASSGLTTGYSGTFAVGDQLVVTTAAPGTVTAGAGFGLAVSVEDGLGHVNTAFHGSVTVSPGDYTTTVQGPLTARVVDGVATFGGLTLDQAGTHTLSLAAAGVASAVTASINVNAATAIQLQVAPPSGAILVNGAFALTVNAVDRFGNVDPSFGSSVTVALASAPAGAHLGGTLTAPAGQGTATFAGLALNQPGNSCTVTASGGGLLGVSAPFAATYQLVVTSVPPNTVTAGTPFGLTVQAEDGVGALASSFTGSVSAALVYSYNHPLSGATTVAAVGGVATFTGLTQTQSTYTALTLSSPGLAPATTTSVDFLAAAPTTLSVYGLYGNQVANAPFSLYVDSLDQYGNNASYTGTVTLTVVGGTAGAKLSGPTTVRINGGYGYVNGLSIDTLGNGYALQATASNGGPSAGTSGRFNVTDQLVVFTKPPASVTAGAPFGVVVEAQDGLGNLDPSFGSAITVNDYGNTSALGGTRTVTAVHGVATFSGLSLTRAGSENLYFGTPGLSNVSTNVAVTAGAATHLVVPALTGNIIVAGPFTVVVDAVDRFGNIDLTFHGNLAVALGAGPAGAALGGPDTAPAANGVATFSGLTLSQVGTGYTLNATSSTLASGTSPAFAATDQFVVTTEPPATITAGVGFGVVVTVEDGLGNRVTSWSGDVSISPGVYGTLQGIRTLHPVNGVVTFSGLTLTQAGTQTLNISSNGLPNAATDAVTVNAGAATQLAFTPIADLVFGAPLSVAVQAEDPFGNVDPSFNGTVAIALSNNPGGATLGGVLTVPASAGVASFAGLTLNQLGTADTLQATSGLMAPGTSAPFSVVDQLVVTVPPPASLGAGGTFGLTATVEDALGRVNAAFNGMVSVSDLYGALGGKLTVQASAGVVTFSGLQLDAAGSHILTLSSPGLQSAATTTITVTPGTARALTISAPAGPVVSGAPFDVKVEAVDDFGNVDTSFFGTISVQVGNPTGTSLAGVVSEAASAGQADFAGLALLPIGTGYTIQASATGLPTIASSAFDVTDQLVLTTAPLANVTAGAGFGLTVKVEDGAGAVNATYSGTVTVALANNYQGDKLGGTLTVPVVNGSATFTGLKLTRAASDYQLQLTSTGLPNVTTGVIAVAPAAATHFALTLPAGGIVRNGHFNVTVAAEDPFGNVDPAYQGQLTLALAGGSHGAVLGGTLTGHAVAGSAVFSGLTVNQLGTGYTLKVTGTPALTAGTSASFAVSDAIVVTGPPASTITAGHPFNLTVSLEDGLRNVDTAAGGTVKVGLGGLFGGGGAGLTGSTTAAVIHGVATFTGLSMTRAGAYALTVSGTGLVPGTTPLINIDAAPAQQLVFSGPDLAGLGNVATPPFSALALAEDQYGNIDPSFTSTVTLSLSTNPTNANLGGAVQVNAVNGVAAFNDLTIDQAGSGYVLTAASPGLTAGASYGFATGNALIVTAAPPGAVAAGAAFGLVVIASDLHGRLDPTFNGAVSLQLDTFAGNGDTLSGPTTVQAHGGVAFFSGLTLTHAGRYGLVITASNLVGTTTDPFTVNAALATQLVVTAPPPVAAGALAGFGLAVSAEDQYGNVDTSFHGSVKLAFASNPGNGTLGGTLVTSATLGVATFSGLTIDRPASGYTLQATSPVLTGPSGILVGPIHITAPTTASQLVVATQPPSSVKARAGFGLVVKAETAGGAVDATFNGLVTLALAANPAGGTLGGNLTVSAVKGVATFSGVSLDVPGGGYTLQASADGVNAGTSGALTVNPGPATQLLVRDPGGNVLAGTPFSLTVQALDAAGNVDPTYNGTVTLTLAANPGGAVLGGTVTGKAASGEIVFPGVTLSKPSAGVIVKASSGSLAAGTTSAFNVTTDQLVVTAAPPASVASGASFGLTVSVENGTGGVDATYNGSVTIALASSDNGSPTLSGSVTVPVSAGVATFTGLGFDLAGTDALALTAPGTGGVTIDAITVTPAAAKRLTIAAAPPSGVTLGTPFGLTIAATDPAGNVDGHYTGMVTLQLAANPGLATLGGLLQVPAVGGIATFAGLTLNHLAAGYTIQATATGLTGITTAPLTVTAVGVATQLVLTAPPTAPLATTTPLALTVTAEDPNGAIDTHFGGPVALTVLNNVTGVTLHGTTMMNAGSGVASFSGLRFDQGGIFTLSASAAGLASATTDPLTVTVAPASQLAIVGPMATLFAGVPFGLKVDAQDSWGNLDTSYSGPIMLTLGANPANAALGGTVTAQAVNGEAVFTNVTLSKPGDGIVLEAGSGALTAGSSVPLTVWAGQLVVTTQPSSAVAAGAPLGLVAKVEDGQGHVLSNVKAAVTVSLSAADGSSAPLGGTMTVNTSGGSATFAGLTATLPGSYTFAVSGPGLLPATSSAVTINPGKATHLALTTAPPSFATTGDGFPVVVAAEDAFGNVDPTFTGSVTLALAANATGAVLGGATATAQAGIATFSSANISKPGTGYTLKATAGKLTSVVSGALTVTAPGVATRLVVSAAPPASVNDNGTFGLTVQAEDGAGTLDAGFTGTVTLGVADSSSGSALGTLATRPASGGVVTFTGLALPTAGTFTLTLSAGNLVGTSAGPLTVNPLTATQLAVSVPAAGVQPGVPFELDVLAQDAAGNLDPTYSGSVTLQLTGGLGHLAGTLTATATAGSAAFPGLTVDQLGSGYTVHATSSPAVTPVTSAAFAAVADALAISITPPSNVRTGVGFSLVISARNAAGQLDAGFTGPVTLLLADLGGTGAALGGSLTANASAGVAVFNNLTLNLPGSYALAAASAGVVSTTTAAFTVAGTAPAALPPSITSAASTALLLNTASRFLITANVPAVSFSETGPLPTGLYLLDNGDGTAMLAGTPTQAGTFHLTLTAGNGKVQSFTLSVLQPPVVTLPAIPTLLVGQSSPFQVTITPGNPGTTTVTLAGKLPPGLAFNTATGLFSGLPTAPGSYPLTVTATNGPGASASQSFTLTVQQPPALVIKGTGVTFTTGTSASFAFSATGFPAPHYSYTDGNLPPGILLSTLPNGSAALTGIPTAAGTYSFTLKASNGAGTDAMQAFTITVVDPPPKAPSFTSAATAAFTTGKAASFTISTAGFPRAALTLKGILPGNVSFVDNHDGTATLSGTPAVGANGTYVLTLTATSSGLPAVPQTFTLTVS